MTEVGVIAPNPIVKAGVVVLVAQVAVTPLLAAAVDTELTVPLVAALITPATSTFNPLPTLTPPNVLAVAAGKV